MRKRINLETAIREAADENECPVIRKLAELTAFNYDMALEGTDETDNDLIKVTITRLFLHGMFDEALTVLSVVFDLLGEDEAGELVAAIGTSGDMFCKRTFTALFLLEYLDILCDLQANCNRGEK